MKPFDLEAALKGAPCVTRDGHKALLVGRVPDCFAAAYPLIGGFVNAKTKGQPTFVLRDWTLDGRWLNTRESPQDLVGMWEDQPVIRHINGHKLWQLEGYRAKCELAEQAASTPISRMEAELTQLSERLDKLGAFVSKPKPDFLDENEWTLLQRQYGAMEEYFNILNERLTIAHNKA